MGGGVHLFDDGAGLKINVGARNNAGKIDVDIILGLATKTNTI